MQELILISATDLRQIVREEIQELNPSSRIPKRRYTLKEAAEYLCIPVPTFRLHQHKIGGAKIGRNWFFTQEELDNYFEANRRYIHSNKYK